jgi:hypothetical protein
MVGSDIIYQLHVAYDQNGQSALVDTILGLLDSVFAFWNMITFNTLLSSLLDIAHKSDPLILFTN